MLKYRISVENTGDRVGDCIITVFLNRDDGSPDDTPLRKLVAFERERSIESKEAQTVELVVNVRDLSVVDRKG